MSSFSTFLTVKTSQIIFRRKILGCYNTNRHPERGAGGVTALGPRDTVGGPETEGGPGVEDVMTFFFGLHMVLGGKLDVGGRDDLFFFIFIFLVFT